MHAYRWDQRCTDERAFTSTLSLLRPDSHSNLATSLNDAMAHNAPTLDGGLLLARSASANSVARPRKIAHVFTRSKTASEEDPETIGAASNFPSGGSLHYASPLIDRTRATGRAATMRSAYSFAFHPPTPGPGTYRNAVHLGVDNPSYRTQKRHLMNAQRAIGEYDMTMPTGTFRKAGAGGPLGEPTEEELIGLLMRGPGGGEGEGSELKYNPSMPHTPQAPGHVGLAFGKPEDAAPPPARGSAASKATPAWVGPGRYNFMPAAATAHPHTPNAIMQGRPPASRKEPLQVAPTTYDLPARPCDTTPAGATHVTRAKPFARAPFAQPWRSAEERAYSHARYKERTARVVSELSALGQIKKRAQTEDRFRRRDERSEEAARRRAAAEQAARDAATPLHPQMQTLVLVSRRPVSAAARMRAGGRDEADPSKG